MHRDNRCMYIVYACFYVWCGDCVGVCGNVCCGDCVGVCGNVCCVANVVKDDVLSLGVLNTNQQIIFLHPLLYFIFVYNMFLWHMDYSDFSFRFIYK